MLDPEECVAEHGAAIGLVAFIVIRLVVTAAAEICVVARAGNRLRVGQPGDVQRGVVPGFRTIAENSVKVPPQQRLLPGALAGDADGVCRHCAQAGERNAGEKFLDEHGVVPVDDMADARMAIRSPSSTQRGAQRGHHICKRAVVWSRAQRSVENRALGARR